MTEAAGPAYRWTIPEYVLRCELYSFSELVVEGGGDRAFFLDHLRRLTLDDVAVLDADYFHITAAEVEAAGFSSGVKGRLLTLGAALCARDQERPLVARVVVVVDRNYDDDVPESVRCVVVTTDGYSIENYALSVLALERFVRVILGRDEPPAGAGGARPGTRLTYSGQDLRDRTVPACIEVAAARRVLRRLAPHRGLFDRWLDYVRVSSDGAAAAETERLLTNVLSSEPGEPVPFDEALVEERDRVAQDPFRLVRGSDYVRVLHHVLRSSWGRRAAGMNFATVPEPNLRRLLLLSVDPVQLDSEPLVETLITRFAA